MNNTTNGATMNATQNTQTIACHFCLRSATLATAVARGEHGVAWINSCESHEGAARRKAGRNLAAVLTLRAEAE